MTKKIQIWTDQETRNQLKAEAALEGMSLSDYLRAITSYHIRLDQLKALRVEADRRGVTVSDLINECIKASRST